jgi:2-desacetyl-2-hydroxyethyl bacteriochlorophyllide A dehydrogenase
METMRAFRIVRPGEFEIRRCPRPEPRRGEVLVRLEYAAMCNQNDYKFFHGKYRGFGYPMDWGAFGHEGVGVVAETGPGVRRPATGDRVVLAGPGGPMLYSEFVLRAADSVVKVAPRVPPKSAAVLELFACAHHALDVAGDVHGRRVAVSGVGPAGLALVQLLRLRRAKEIVAIDPSRARLNAARKAGASATVNAAAAGMKRLAADPPAVFIDASGYVESMRTSLRLAGELVVIFGFTQQPFEVVQSEWFARELVIKNTALHTAADLAAVCRLLERGRIDPSPFISRVMRFEKYAEAVELIGAKKVIKILLTWD